MLPHILLSSVSSALLRDSSACGAPVPRSNLVPNKPDILPKRTHLTCERILWFFFVREFLFNPAAYSQCVCEQACPCDSLHRGTHGQANTAYMFWLLRNILVCMHKRSCLTEAGPRVKSHHMLLIYFHSSRMVCVCVCVFISA